MFNTFPTHPRSLNSLFMNYSYFLRCHLFSHPQKAIGLSTDEQFNGHADVACFIVALWQINEIKYLQIIGGCSWNILICCLKSQYNWRRQSFCPNNSKPITDTVQELKFVEKAVSLEPKGQIGVLSNTKRKSDKILSRKSNWKMQEVKSKKKNINK